MKMLVWNCQGLGGSMAVSQLQEFCRIHSPNIVFLCETKNKKDFVRKVCRKIRFQDFCVVDPVGVAGGLALFWQQGVTIADLQTSHCTIEVKIEDPIFKKHWWFIGVYISPNPVSRRDYWAFLTSRMRLWGDYFILAGDFNDILSPNEKQGGISRSDSSFAGFRNFISSNSLCDIGYQGQFWTWRRTVAGQPTTLERLDRFLCSRQWSDLFSRAICKHLFTFASDHVMLLGDTNPTTIQGRRPFIFDQRWIGMEGLNDAVGAGWSTQYNGSKMFRFMKKIKAVRVQILKWKGGRNFNAKFKIEELKNRLETAILANGNSSEINAIKTELVEAYKSEELFWAQKARISWLKEGDKNTRFFHASVSNRRKKNQIMSLKKANSNIWCQSLEEFSNEFAAYYSSLFSSTGNFDELQRHFGSLSPKISHEDNQMLMQPITENEIRRAVFSMKAHSAPGPDGMTPLFYKNFYSTIKDELMHMIQGFFSSGNMLRELNHTCIALIPKHAAAIEVSHFRPISLCNVSYRILSKILANRMKKVLASCISSNQSAFISNRLITDNYILAHEVLNAMNHKRSGKEGIMALKIDMAKAFDRVEWPFIRFIMQKLGFCDGWIHRIMACVTTTSYSFIINGVRSGFVKPSRGLRQGDPLSPYLFLLCAEGLSLLLNNAESEGLITGFKIARPSPSISHLFFADDSLIFCKADSHDAENLARLLNVYQACSGQLINYQKSAVFFSKNVTNNQKSVVLSHFHNIVIASHTKYLGLPLIVGRSKRDIFSELKSKVSTKLTSWKNSLLNQCGKEIMLKSVITMILAYPMSVLKFPKYFCKEISSLMTKFYWGNDAEQRKGIPWLAWKKLCLPKGMGGLGLRDMEALNMAYLAKQIWRIMKNPDLLVARVLKAKYFPYCSILEAKNVANSSYFWKSIRDTLHLFKEGCCWNVGNGESVKIWEDNWLPENPNKKPYTPAINSPSLFWVSDLIENHSWNEDKVKKIFWPVDAHQILSIPISKCDTKDEIFWSHTHNGCFSLKTAYSYFFNKLNRPFILGNDLQGCSSSSTGDTKKTWKFLWSLNLPNKVKLFFWKCLRNVLPCNINLSKRLRANDISPNCSFCGHNMESVEHILVKCDRARDAWRHLQFYWDSFDDQGFNIYDWWDDIVANDNADCNKGKIEQTLYMFWHLWKSRNEWVFNRNVNTPDNIAALAIHDYADFQQANKSNAVNCWPNMQLQNLNNNLYSSRSIDVGSTTANDSQQVFFIQTDAAWLSSLVSAGGGFAIWDSNGNLIEVWGKSFNFLNSALRAEAEAIRWALLIAKEKKWCNVVIKTDSQVLCSMINCTRAAIPEVFTIIKDIQALMAMFATASVTHISRKLNILSHNVAAFAKKLVNPFFWIKSFPSWINSLAIQEIEAKNVNQTL